MMPVRVGQRLGNYRLIQLLDKGAFAEVYLGEHVYLQNYAAVKILLTSFNDKEKQHFLSEAQTLARLTHPNIVQVREFAVERGIPFLAMDYAPAGSLQQRYPKGSSLSLEQTVTFVKQVADALQYAHNHQIIHNTIIANNHALTGPDLSGMIITNGHNLIQDFSGITFADPLNIHLTDLSGFTLPKLEIDPQLKNNGGATPTLALLPGSPAIDQIRRSARANTTDQRGVKRPQGAACDIGAYEYVPTQKG